LRLSSLSWDKTGIILKKHENGNFTYIHAYWELFWKISSIQSTNQSVKCLFYELNPCCGVETKFTKLGQNWNNFEKNKNGNFTYIHAYWELLWKVSSIQSTNQSVKCLFYDLNPCCGVETKFSKLGQNWNDFEKNKNGNFTYIHAYWESLWKINSIQSTNQSVKCLFYELNSCCGVGSKFSKLGQNLNHFEKIWKR
jgi:hypothetical protein